MANLAPRLWLFVYRTNCTGNVVQCELKTCQKALQITSEMILSPLTITLFRGKPFQNKTISLIKAQ